MRFLVVSISLMFATVVLALELTQSQLQGKWLIVQMNDMDVRHMNHVWVCKGNIWQTNSNGVELTPDPYAIKGDIIDLGHSRMRVMSISEKSMEVEMFDAYFLLEKIP